MANIADTAVSRKRKPDLIPGYSLDVMLGRGGMGEVYKATQRSLGRTVAIKLLSDELAKDDSFVARFEKEAAALAALSHPNIVSVVDKGCAEGTYYLVMEFADGASLREVMRAPDVAPEAKLKVAYDVCRAMEYAHGRGIIHRDLKPENILFDDQAGGIPKVSDFGLAGFLEENSARFNLTGTHVSMGTLSYMAPEQRSDAGTADHRADIYSLGVILYELLAGELPVGTFSPPSTRKKGVDKRLDAVVGRCLKPAPDERYQHVSELLGALEPVVSMTASMKPRRVSLIARAQFRAKQGLRGAMRWAAALLVVAAAGVLALALARPYLRLRDTKALGEKLAAVGHPEGSLSVPARVEESAGRKSWSMGSGPSAADVRWLGRPLSTESGGAFRMDAASVGASGVALWAAADAGASRLRWMADLAAPLWDLGWLGRLRRAALAEPQRSSSTLLLLGERGRFAAVSVFSDGTEPRFEYDLGDRAGVFQPLSGRSERPTAGMRVVLELDERGELKATVGERQLGEALALGANARRAFGGSLRPALGCTQGVCEFRRVLFESGHEPPAAAEVPRPPEPPPPHGGPAHRPKGSKSKP